MEGGVGQVMAGLFSVRVIPELVFKHSGMTRNRVLFISKFNSGDLSGKTKESTG